jgi:hypothetical protein
MPVVHVFCLSCRETTLIATTTSPSTPVLDADCRCQRGGTFRDPDHLVRPVDQLPREDLALWTGAVGQALDHVRWIEHRCGPKSNPRPQYSRHLSFVDRLWRELDRMNGASVHDSLREHGPTVASRTRPQAATDSDRGRQHSLSTWTS